MVADAVKDYIRDVQGFRHKLKDVLEVLNKNVTGHMVWLGGDLEQSGRALCISPAGRRFNSSIVQFAFPIVTDVWPETHERLALALGAGALSFT
jgi:hypothetical protein